MKFTEFRFADYRLIAAARELWKSGQLQPLPPRVFDCLVYLVENRDRAIGRDELASAVWGRVDITDGQIGQLVMRVRRVFKDDGEQQSTIRTITGFGYRWVVPVTMVEVAEAPMPVSVLVDGSDIEDPADGESTPLIEQAPAEGMRARPTDIASAASVHRRRSMQWMIGTVLLLIVAVVVGLRFGTRPAASTDEVTVVLPVLVEAPSEFDWVRLGLMDMVADRLRGAGLTIPQTERALMLLAQLPETGSVQQQLASLPAALNIGQLVHVMAARDGDQWRVEMELVTHAGVQQRQVARDVQIVEAARQATDRLLAVLGWTPALAQDGDAGLEERLSQVRSAIVTNQLDTAHALLDTVPAEFRDDPRVRLRRAQVHDRGGQLDDAMQVYEHLLTDAAIVADRRMHSRVLAARGAIHQGWGDYRAAERDHNQAVDLLDGLHAPAELATALNGRVVARLSDRLDESVQENFDDLSRARALLEQAGDLYGALVIDVNRAAIEASQQRPAAAITLASNAAEQLEAIGVINDALNAHYLTMYSHMMLLQWQQAIIVSDHSWALRDRVVSPSILLSSLVVRGEILLGLGRYDEFDQLFDGAEQMFVGERNRISLHHLLAVRAFVAGAFEKVIEHIHVVFELAGNEDSRPDPYDLNLLLLRAGADIPAPTIPESDQLGYLLLRAELAVKASSNEEANVYFKRALNQASRRGMPREISVIATSYGEWLLATGRTNEAEVVLGRLISWARHDYDCALMLVALYHAKNEPDAWRSALNQAQQLAGDREIPERWLQPPAAP